MLLLVVDLTSTPFVDATFGTAASGFGPYLRPSFRWRPIVYDIARTRLLGWRRLIFCLLRVTMNYAQIAMLSPRHRDTDRRVTAGRPMPGSFPTGAIAGWQDELAFASLQRSYLPYGGLGRGADIERLLVDRCPATFNGMTQLLDDREIFGFEWRQSLWMPMFQLRSDDLSIKPGPRLVQAELGYEFDGWTLSAWFVEPNVWLGKRRPVELMESDIDAVLRAARADRFVAAG